MGKSLADLFASETDIVIKASELFTVMKEASKAELLLNAAKCEVPYTYARQIATGIKEETPTSVFVGIDLSSGEDSSRQQDTEADENSDAPAAGQTIGSGPVGITRSYEQRVEWIDIQDIIKKGHAGVSLPPGTEINFTLKNGDPASVVVVGVNHYEKGDCVFWFRRIVGRHCMNKNGSNKGGFSDAEDMREYLEKIYSMLPDELKSVIALHKTVQKIDGKKFRSESRLFLPSEYEVKGKQAFAEYNGIDKQFPFFTEQRNRVAYDEDGDPCWYWTSDPSEASATYFCAFFNDGASDYNAAYGDGGVAPLFVINNQKIVTSDSNGAR